MSESSAGPGAGAELGPRCGVTRRSPGRPQLTLLVLQDVSGLKKIHVVGPHATAVLDALTTRCGPAPSRTNPS